MTRPASLTDDQMRLAVVLADTDLGLPLIARRLGLSLWATKVLVAGVYRALGVHSRQHLRSVLLECELAAVVS